MGRERGRKIGIQFRYLKGTSSNTPTQHPLQSRNPGHQAEPRPAAPWKLLLGVPQALSDGAAGAEPPSGQSQRPKKELRAFNNEFHRASPLCKTFIGCVWLLRHSPWSIPVVLECLGAEIWKMFSVCNIRSSGEIWNTRRTFHKYLAWTKKKYKTANSHSKSQNLLKKNPKRIYVSPETPWPAGNYPCVFKKLKSQLHFIILLLLK